MLLTEISSWLHERRVLSLVSRNEIPRDTEIGKLVIMLTTKRSGRKKARLVYIGRTQRFEITD